MNKQRRCTEEFWSYTEAEIKHKSSNGSFTSQLLKEVQNRRVSFSNKIFYDLSLQLLDHNKIPKIWLVIGTFPDKKFEQAVMQYYLISEQMAILTPEICNRTRSSKSKTNMCNMIRKRFNSWSNKTRWQEAGKMLTIFPSSCGYSSFIIPFIFNFGGSSNRSFTQ